MKKSIGVLSIVLGAIGLTAIGIINQPTEPAIEVSNIEPTKTLADNESTSPPDFAFDMGSRFFATISKEDLEKAKSVTEIIPKDADWSAYPIKNVRVKLITDNTEVSESGYDLTLNQQQLSLLKTANYSDNLRLLGSYGNVNAFPFVDEQYDLNYMITVVPEKEAAYAEGKDKLLAYLKENSSVIVSSVQGQNLGAGKIAFTIDTQGNVANVRLIGTSNHLFVDQHMLNLIPKLSGKWIPAENARGEKVEQTLVFSFGSMGC